MNQPKRKRRLFSFSLRGLLICMLLLACLFGWIGIRYRRALEQQAILERIRETGGVPYIHDDGYNPHDSQDMRYGIAIANPTTRDLFFDGNFIDRIDEVTYDDGSNPNFDDLASLKNLESLNLSGTEVTDLAPLRRLNNLQHLFLGGTEVTGLAPLRGLKNLQLLYLYGTEVTDLAPLRGLKNLKALRLSGTEVTDLTPLRGLKNLQWLDLNDTKVTDLAPLWELKNLKLLDLDGTKVTDITPLRELKNLQELLLDESIDDKEIQRLKKALPNCDIQVNK